MEDFNVTQLDATKWPVVGGIYRNNTIPGSMRVTAIVPSLDGRTKYDRIHANMIHSDGSEGGPLSGYRISIQDCYHPTDQGPIPKLTELLRRIVSLTMNEFDYEDLNGLIYEARTLLAGLDKGGDGGR